MQGEDDADLQEENVDSPHWTDNQSVGQFIFLKN